MMPHKPGNYRSLKAAKNKDWLRLHAVNHQLSIIRKTEETSMIIYSIVWEHGRPCIATDIERAYINASVTAMKKHYVYKVRSA